MRHSFSYKKSRIRHMSDCDRNMYVLQQQSCEDRVCSVYRSVHCPLGQPNSPIQVDEL